MAIANPSKPARSEDPEVNAYAQAFEKWNALAAQVPFLGKDGIDHWAVPQTGTYTGACATGQAAGTAYVKYLRELRKIEPGEGASLQRVVLDMVPGLRAMNDSVRGQLIGFLTEIDRALSAYVNLMVGVDSVTFKSLAGRMAAGAARTEADELRTERRRRAASRGWRKRRRICANKAAGARA
jgi:hypothetical protein